MNFKKLFIVSIGLFSVFNLSAMHLYQTTKVLEKEAAKKATDDLVQLFASTKFNELSEKEKNEFIQRVRDLLAQGANPNGNESNAYYKPLIVAATYSTPQVVALLLEAGANPNITQDTNTTALIKAAAADNSQIVSLLLKHGANPNLKNNAGEFALVEAAAHKWTYDIVDLLLQHKADVNMQDTSGETALMAAAREGNPRMVDNLLKHGAKANIKDNKGYTALYAAVTSPSFIHHKFRHGKYEAMQLLLEHGADPNIQGHAGNAALIVAAGLGDTSLVRLLLEHGAKPNVQNDQGDTALISFARKSQRADVAELLLNHKANPNIADENGNTALHYAARNGSLGLVRFLIEHGADSKAVNKWGQNPLFVAAANGHESIVQLLIQNAQKRAQDIVRQARAEQASYLGLLPGDLLRMQTTYIVEDLNKQDNAGDTALIAAVKNGHIETVRLLLQHGADPLIRDAKGKYAFELAQKEILLLHDAKDQKIIDLLNEKIEAEKEMQK